MRRIIRHIKEGFLGVIRHFALSFSSMMSMAVTLTLLAVFLLLNSNLIKITEEIENRVSLYVQLEADVDEDQIDELKTEISAVRGVTVATFSSKHEELEIFITNRGEEGEELFGDFRGENNPFLDVFIVNTNNTRQIADISSDITELEHVNKVTYGGEATQSLLDIMTRVRDFGLIFVIVLGAVAIFLIVNTIGATIHSREKEISIMRQVGATNWYIRIPFVIEGIIIGILGSIVPILITIYGYGKVYNIQATSIGSMFNLVDIYPLVWEVSGIIVIAGAAIGAVGSLISVSRRLRWTR